MLKYVSPRYFIEYNVHCSPNCYYLKSKISLSHMHYVFVMHKDSKKHTENFSNYSMRNKQGTTFVAFVYIKLITGRQVSNAERVFYMFRYRCDMNIFFLLQEMSQPAHGKESMHLKGHILLLKCF